MAAATGAADGGGRGSSNSSNSSVSSSVSPAPPVAVEAVAAEWMLEFACSCLCRHFAEQSGAEFWRWRDVAQALINGLSQIPPRQKKTVYLCQLLIRVAQGKSLGLQFENDQRISPLESALSFWTLLESEENKLEKLHEDIRRLIQIQIVAVHMENRYFKEAAEVLERLFTDSESDKPLRVKLATVIKTKDPYVPLLQSFSYSLLIRKIKSYINLFMKENETNFLLQEATKHLASKGLGATALLNRPLEVNENDKSDLETKQRRASPDTSERYDERLIQKKPMEIIPNEKIEVQNASYLQLKCLGNRLPKEVFTAPNLTGFKKHLHSGQAHGVTPEDGRAGLKAELSDPFGSLLTQQVLYVSSRLVKEEQYVTSQSSGDIKKATIRRCSRQKPKESRVLQSLNVQNVGKNEVSLACGRRRQRWTHKEDLELKQGVREFGVGNWAKILVHGNFSNRTSVMLKDRWRTLSKIKQEPTLLDFPLHEDQL